MRYSPEPHEHYIVDGVGPGANFLGDMEKWNWRWTKMGTVPCQSIDGAINLHFNDSQRYLMTLPPAEALLWLEQHVPSMVDDVTRERLIDAQTRLFPPLIVKRDGNIIFATFKKAA